MAEEIKVVEEDLLTKAQAIAERIEKANAESKLILEKAEKLRVTEILGGRSVAAEKPKTQEDVDQEVANRFISRFKHN